MGPLPTNPQPLYYMHMVPATDQFHLRRSQIQLIYMYMYMGSHTTEHSTLCHPAKPIPRSPSGHYEPDPETRDPSKSIMGKNLAENERKSHCAQKPKSVPLLAILPQSTPQSADPTDLTFCLGLPSGELELEISGSYANNS